MRHEFEGKPEREQPKAADPQQQPGERERLASAVGSSALARAASSRQATPSLARGAPMSIARALSDLDDAPEELAHGHSERAEGGGAQHELQHASDGAPEATASEAVGAADTSAEHVPEDEEHGTRR